MLGTRIKGYGQYQGNMVKGHVQYQCKKGMLGNRVKMHVGSQDKMAC